MRFSSYVLILIFSLFSQGFLLSVSKSLRKAEDNMLLSTFSLGKVIQNAGKPEKSRPASSLEHYKIEDSSFLNEEDDGTPKFSVSVLFLAVVFKTVVFCGIAEIIQSISMTILNKVISF